MSYRIVLANKFRELALSFEFERQLENVFDLITDLYDIKLSRDTNIIYALILAESLGRLNPDLVKKCGIKEISFENLGHSKDLYPNHGIYRDKVLVLNTNLLKDDKIIIDRKNKVFYTKFDQTFYHELGHGWDNYNGKGKDLSLREDWLKLSGWTKEPIEGKRKIHIYDINTPKIEGEYYYSSTAKFTRFYGRRNPWDDWADCFSYYVGGLYSYIPKEKKKYFDNLLKDYIKR